jgi:BlaI family transcriptional regulator, penicillinase repressor
MEPSAHRLGDLQLRILQVLWDKPDSTVGDVHAELFPERRLAYTTIATMLRKMEVRGLVSHRGEGRAFLYRAAVGAEKVGRDAGEHFVERLFDGSLADAVSHLLKTREVSREELDRLEKMIREAKRRTP